MEAKDKQWGNISHSIILSIQQWCSSLLSCLEAIGNPVSATPLLSCIERVWVLCFPVSHNILKWNQTSSYKESWLAHCNHKSALSKLLWQPPFSFQFFPNSVTSYTVATSSDPPTGWDEVQLLPAPLCCCYGSCGAMWSTQKWKSPHFFCRWEKFMSSFRFSHSPFKNSC